MIQTGMYAMPFQLGWRTSIKIIKALNPIEECHQQNMPQPHWYLSALGVAPSQQGQGIGSLLLQPVLQQADAGNLQALEQKAHQ
ncbi:MAG: GNAT family N-acetyltransferase [Heteroscytonema crispum UTEX LB 1556]